ncbi:glycerol dehydrogenase [Christensenellaceae bacterium NSJ-44]|uniref:Glycerol dehydrogenase n=1 Tax=Luoshenia tenuis TaxID=2763654 RepID=A0A926HLU3_9FIRM|nr:glycerol dehydrogenase [Luoshenia tenuis]MBC8527930.1 glycerol dehydrogenase [Luoshenia tenuis]
MAKIIASPSRYIQGKGELKNIRTHVEKLGTKWFILTSPSGKKRVEPAIGQSLSGSECTAVYEDFNGECCDSEIGRITEVYQRSGCDVVIGIGGGKIHDTAKAVAHGVGAPVVIVPTIASTDAPCSALSVIYTDDGVFDRYLFLPASPNIVLVDTDIVAAAPARLLISGMGDALATYFEARACRDSDAGNCVGGKTTLAAMQLARLCYDTLLADGFQAALAVENHVCTKAVEKVIEANTYLSGIGFESGGLAGAHAIHNGLTAIEQTHKLYHGEKVAFGTLVQLVLEDAAIEELEEVLDFCMSVGLPTTLADLGIEQVEPEKIMEVARLACADTDTLHNMPFEVNADMVYAAIMGADALGKAYKDE